MAEISIIVPVYKAEQYLERCIKSILSQTFAEYEVILVDDGSPDHCPDICDRWSEIDNRIKVLHKENGGSSSARNAGLGIARGKYIGFVDVDDWITPDFYECLYRLIRQYHANIAMCEFTRKPRELESGIRTEVIKELDRCGMQKLFYRMNGEPSRYSVWNRLYEAEILKGIRFAEGIINEDVLFTYETYKKADKLVFLKQKKYLYFKNSDGITRSKLCGKDFSLFKVWDEIVWSEKGKPDQECAELNRLRATFTLYVKALIYGCERDFDKSVLKKWRNELQKNGRYLLKSSCLDQKRKALLLWIIVIG